MEWLGWLQCGRSSDIALRNITIDCRLAGLRSIAALSRIVSVRGEFGCAGLLGRAGLLASVAADGVACGVFEARVNCAVRLVVVSVGLGRGVSPRHLGWVRSVGCGFVVACLVVTCGVCAARSRGVSCAVSCCCGVVTFGVTDAIDLVGVTIACAVSVDC